MVLDFWHFSAPNNFVLFFIGFCLCCTLFVFHCIFLHFFPYLYLYKNCCKLSVSHILPFSIKWVSIESAMIYKLYRYLQFANFIKNGFNYFVSTCCNLYLDGFAVYQKCGPSWSEVSRNHPKWNGVVLKWHEVNWKRFTYPRCYSRWLEDNRSHPK